MYFDLFKMNPFWFLDCNKCITLMRYNIRGNSAGYMGAVYYFVNFSLTLRLFNK